MSQIGAVYEVPSRPGAVIKPTAPRRRHRVKNWLLRLIMLVIVVIAIIGVAIQIILSTDLPP